MRRITTVQSLDELDELFFQRVYERHYGLPWCIGETEQLKIRESTEEDVEKLLAFFTDEEARRWLFEGEGKLFSEEEQREKLKAYVRNRYGFYGYGFYSVLWKETGELAAWAGFSGAAISGKTGAGAWLSYGTFFPASGDRFGGGGTSVGRDGGSHRRNKGFYFLSSGKSCFPTYRGKTLSPLSRTFPISTGRIVKTA